MGTNAELYDQDFYAWVQEQAALLKARQFDAIDLDNLIEEVESLARQERHLLWHRFRTLLTHLVACWGEIPAHCIQWEGVIATQRQENPGYPRRFPKPCTPRPGGTRRGLGECPHAECRPVVQRRLPCGLSLDACAGP